MTLPLTRRVAGTPDMKATSLRETAVLTPTCQSLVQPGDRRALKAMLENTIFRECLKDKPFQEGYRVVEAKHGLVVLNIMTV